MYLSAEQGRVELGKLRAYSELKAFIERGATFSRRGDQPVTMVNSKSVLVIEDDAEILLSLKAFLELMDYKVLAAENGLAALELLRTSELPKLILLDMKMPIMDGWEFADKFRNTYGRQVPILVMTAAADAEQRARDIQAAGWVSKPFDLDMFLEKVKQYEKN